MNCPKCGANNPDYFIYCKKCSEKLPQSEPTAAQYAEKKIEAYKSGEMYEAAGEPFYIPSQRHKAADPWELLEDERKHAPATEKYRNEDFLEPAKQYRRRTDRRAEEIEPIETHKPRSHKEEVHRPVIHKAQEVSITPKAQPVAEPVEPEYVEPTEAETPVEAPALEPVQEEYVPQPAHIKPEKPAEEAAEDPTEKVYGMTRRFARPERPVPIPVMDDEDEAEIDVDALFEDEDEKPGKLKKKKKKEAMEPDDGDEKPGKLKKKKLPEPEEEYDEDEDEEGGRRSGVIFWIIIALLAVALLVVSLKIVSDKYGSIGNAFNVWFGGGEQMEEFPTPTIGVGQASVVVEETEYEGMNAHSIIVYGTDGDTVVFYDPSTGEELKSAVITNGGYKLTIVDLNWIPLEAGSQTEIQVKPLVSVFAADGTETRLDVEAFTVAVPATMLELTSSEVGAPLEVTTADSVITITGNTEAGTPTRLFWNGEEITASIDSATGIFIADVPITPAEVTEYELKATMDRHSDAVIAIKLNVTVAEVALEVTGPTGPVEEENGSVSGKTEVGAVVTVAGTGAGKVTVNADGSFSFPVDLTARYGTFRYEVSATLNGVTSSKSFAVIHAPGNDEYIRSAQVVDYNNILTNPNTQGILYEIKGEVTAIDKSNADYQVVSMNVDGDENKPITIHYYSTTELKTKKTYKLFGFADGTTEDGSMPKVDSWYFTSRV